MRIEELELLAADLAAQRDFYSGLLGLPSTFDDGRLAIQAGASRLIFRQAPPGWDGFYHFAFNIPENQYAEAGAWISRRVLLIADRNGVDNFYFEGWNASPLYFYDPAGNIAEFIARHNLANASDWPFNEQSILNISEIGIATDDVHETVGLLGKDAGLLPGAGAPHPVPLP